MRARGLPGARRHHLVEPASWARPVRSGPGWGFARFAAGVFWSRASSGFGCQPRAQGSVTASRAHPVRRDLSPRCPNARL